MNQADIISGPAEVIASGTVISFLGNPLKFTFGPPEHRLRLILVFAQQEEEPENPLSGEIIDENTLQLTLTNVGSPLGSGTLSPLLMGEIGGRQLFVHLRVHELKGGDRTVHYCFYLSEEVEEND